MELAWLAAAATLCGAVSMAAATPTLQTTISEGPDLMPDEYVPPRVWTWDPEFGGRFAAINRPASSATHASDLPVGDHSTQLYSADSPNGQKVTTMLAELIAAGQSGAKYNAWLIDFTNGEQFGSGFVDVNPKSKIPAMLEPSASSAEYQDSLSSRRQPDDRSDGKEERPRRSWPARLPTWHADGTMGEGLRSRAAMDARIRASSLKRPYAEIEAGSDAGAAAAIRDGPMTATAPCTNPRIGEADALPSVATERARAVLPRTVAVAA